LPIAGFSNPSEKSEGRYNVAHVQVYEPFRRGLPKVLPYFAQVWRRRSFVAEYSRSYLRAQNFGSLFGQLWLILNPLLLAFVYFLLIIVIGGDADGKRFAHLTSGLFLFYLVTNAVSEIPRISCHMSHAPGSTFRRYFMNHPRSLQHLRHLNL